MDEDVKQKLRDYIDELIKTIHGDEQLELFKIAIFANMEPMMGDADEVTDGG